MKYSYKKSYKQEQVDKGQVDAKLLRRLLHYLEPYKWWVIFAIVLLLIAKIIEAFVPIFIGKMSQVILNQSNASEAVKDTLLSTITQSALWISIVLFLGYSLEALNVYVKSWVGQKALYTLRLQVYDHIQHMPLAYFDRNTIGRLMTRTIHDVEQINQMFTESIVPIFGSLLLFVCMVGGIFYLEWRLGVVIVFIMPIAFVLTNYFRVYQRRCYDRIRSIVSAMNTFIQEHLMGASTVRNFGLQKREERQFEEINIDHCNAYMESVDNFSFFIASIDFLQSLTLIAVFAILVYFAAAPGEFQAGIFFTLSLYTMMFFRPLSDLAERYNVLQSAFAASERIFHVLDDRRENENKEGIVLDGIESIVFDNVWFAYEKENWVLKGLSFEIKKGDSVALVGPTGAGKTSIMSLLLRFYDYQKGSILINGKDIKEYTLASVRKQFSVVLQDPVIFSGTIYENIALYRSAITRDKVEEVIDYMGMRPFIKRFPLGIDHVLTERGQSLSLGQMQLIAMARAVAEDRSVLVLDEATANIDTATERVIQDALQKILLDKTALVIAHRLSTIKDVKKIMVLNQGQLAESGTHGELLKTRGIYEKLYRLQFRE